MQIFAKHIIIRLIIIMKYGCDQTKTEQRKANRTFTMPFLHYAFRIGYFKSGMFYSFF